jgi:sigma-B regulation protein RsbU (phosphoserine phosphatase)
MEATPLPGTDDLYEGAPCGLLVAGGRGQILRVNGTLCRWLGYERAELLDGRRFQDLLTMGGRIFHQTHLAPLLRMQGSVAEVKLDLRRKDGTTIPTMANVVERHWQGELLLHASVFMAEERHKYEQELLLQRRRAQELAQRHEQAQLALAEAQRKLEALLAQASDRALFAEQMVGIVSHDLRNPLSAITMSAQLLARLGPDERQATVVDRISRSAGRAQRLIVDLLDFTQARLGRGLQVKRAPVDVHAVVAESVSELALAFPERTIRHLREGDGACEADADRLAQAVGNLVANAVAYGSPAHPITVATRGMGAWLELSVHNEGPAIAEAVLPRLFEPMVRGADHQSALGVGLGLYIVREIAQAHGGTVGATSSADAGTCFRIKLPVA